MKLLKTCLIMLLASTMLLTACNKAAETTAATTTALQQGDVTAAPEDTRSLQEIYDDFMKDVTAELPMLAQQKVPNGSYEYYFGIKKPSSAKEALVSEPMVGSIPFAVTLLKVDPSADANALAQEIKDKVDPRRWVCVTASYVETAVKGNVILLVLDGDNARGAQIVNAFNG